MLHPLRVFTPGAALLCALLAAPQAQAANATMSIHVTTIFGAPLSAIDVAVTDTRTGVVVSAPGLVTNASGDVVLTIPTGRYDLHFTPPPGARVFAADKNGVRLDQSITVPAQLPPGVQLRAQMNDPLGAGVAHVDLRFADASGNVPLHVTGAITDEAGAADVLVTPGTWTVWAEPRLDRRIAPGLLGTLSLQTDRDAGAFVLEPGHAWTAHVTNESGVPIAGAGFRVRASASQLERFAGFGVTDSLGAATLVIPSGTYDVSALPVAGSLRSARTARAQVVTGDMLGPTLVLPLGVHVSAQCLVSGGGVLAGVECRLDSLPSRAPQELVGAASDAAGALDAVAPIGPYSIALWPPPALGLVPQGLESVQLASSLDLGTRTFAHGRRVTLAVRDAASGLPLAGVRVVLHGTAGDGWLPVADPVSDASGSIVCVAGPGRYQMQLRAPLPDWPEQVRELAAGIGDTTVTILLSAPGAGVAGGRAVLPHWRAWPVPSRGVVWLSDGRSGSGILPCAVYDAAGRLVRRWSAMRGADGVHWDGCDAAGARVSEGLYLVRIGEDAGRTARVVIVR